MKINFCKIGKEYIEKGLCVLPANKGTKCPIVAWKEYQYKLPSEQDWNSWGQNTNGICIVCGAISGNLLVLDFDDSGSRFKAWYQSIPKELRAILVIVRTKNNGYHVYFRCDGKPMGNVKLARTAEGQSLIETRGEGGLVLCPPTPGYELISGSFEDIAVFTPEEVETLLKTALSLDETPMSTVYDAKITKSHETSIQDDRKIKRAIAYLETMSPAIQGQNGSAVTMSVVNKLYEFGLEQETAKSVFMERYNPRCQPPWSGKEIDHKLDDAFSKPFKSAGCLLDALKESNPPNNNSSSHSVRRPRLIDPATIEEKKIQWLWFERFALGMLSLIAGLAGLGKSFFTCYMASIITTGKEWSDGTSCEKGSVLFFHGEDSISDTYKRRLKAHKADENLIRFLDGAEIFSEGREVQEAPFSLADCDVIEEAIRDTEKATGFPVKMVVIDPISNYWGNVNENSNAEVRSVLKPLARLAERTNVAFILVHHIGKAERNHAQQNILGSTGIVAACRLVWQMFSHRNKNNQDVKILAPSKINCCDMPPALEFIINQGAIDVTNPHLHKTADEIINDIRQHNSHLGRKPKQLQEATEWLQDFLANGRKPVGSKNPLQGTVRYEAEQAGHSWKTTLRAANEIGIIKSDKPVNGAYYWALPDVSRVSNMQEHSDILGNLECFETQEDSHIENSCDESQWNDILGNPITDLHKSINVIKGNPNQYDLPSSDLSKIVETQDDQGCPEFNSGLPRSLINLDDLYLNYPASNFAYDSMVDKIRIMFCEYLFETGGKQTIKDMMKAFPLKKQDIADALQYLVDQEQIDFEEIEGRQHFSLC